MPSSLGEKAGVSVYGGSALKRKSLLLVAFPGILVFHAEIHVTTSSRPLNSRLSLVLAYPSRPNVSADKNEDALKLLSHFFGGSSTAHSKVSIHEGRLLQAPRCAVWLRDAICSRVLTQLWVQTSMRCTSLQCQPRRRRPRKLL